MTLQIGSNPIAEVYYGSQKIKEIYNGSQLVYTAEQDPYVANQIVLQVTAAESGTVDILMDGVYDIYAVSGGGGAIAGNFSDTLGEARTVSASGGGGGYLYARFSLKKGSYSYAVGAGGNANSSPANFASTGSSGGLTRVDGLFRITGGSGGEAGTSGYGVGGAGGTVTLIATPTITVSNKAGNDGSAGAEVEGGAAHLMYYGAGGFASNDGTDVVAQNGDRGFLRIVFISK